MDTDGVVRGRGRRRLPLRLKIALAGLAGVGVAWLIPKAGQPPAPEPSATPSDRPGITSAEFQLSSIPQGVTFRRVDGVRIFLVRTGGSVDAFLGGTAVYWCPRTGSFETDSQPVALQNLDRIRVLVAGGRVTVFPHSVVPGVSPAPGQTAATERCSASERVG